MRTQCHFLDLEDSFISRIELSRFEVVFIIPSTASVAAADGRKDNLPPREHTRQAQSRCGDLFACLRYVTLSSHIYIY
jgi:hypothetical protein